jgi:hypothetical protein
VAIFYIIFNSFHIELNLKRFLQWCCSESTAFKCLLFFFGLLHPEAEGAMILQNIGNYSPKLHSVASQNI